MVLSLKRVCKWYDFKCWREAPLVELEGPPLPATKISPEIVLRHETHFPTLPELH
jgi:hypothetical protein